MTLLTRENLRDGSFRRGFPMPAHLAWSEERLAQSLSETWAQRPDDTAVWVFAYGSLIWNPLIVHDAVQPARLDGWRRSFCMRSVTGRGSPQHPGRMLSLQSGGCAQGLALHLPPAQAQAELRLLWTREMSSGAYRPLWLPVVLAGGACVQAICFVARPEHPLHAPDDDPATVAAHVTHAHGVLGPNADYLRTLARALAAHGLTDPYVDAVLGALDAQEAAAAQPVCPRPGDGVASG